MDDFPVIFGTTGLLISCLIIFVVLAIAILVLWLYLACLVDAFQKDEAVFKDRTLWITLLIGSFFVGMMWIAAFVYYAMYRPKLAFWIRD